MVSNALMTLLSNSFTEVSHQTFHAEAKHRVHGLLDEHVIRLSVSRWSSPIVLVRKKDGKIRMCVDYRARNAKDQT